VFVSAISIDAALPPKPNSDCGAQKEGTTSERAQRQYNGGARGQCGAERAPLTIVTPLKGPIASRVYQSPV
jgi:hypothetical protein